jgi:hypothetical protein
MERRNLDTSNDGATSQPARAIRPIYVGHTSRASIDFGYLRLWRRDEGRGLHRFQRWRSPGAAPSLIRLASAPVASEDDPVDRPDAASTMPARFSFARAGLVGNVIEMV